MVSRTAGVINEPCCGGKRIFWRQNVVQNIDGYKVFRYLVKIFEYK